MVCAHPCHPAGGPAPAPAAVVRRAAQSLCVLLVCLEYGRLAVSRMQCACDGLARGAAERAWEPATLADPERARRGLCWDGPTASASVHQGLRFGIGRQRSSQSTAVAVVAGLARSELRAQERRCWGAHGGCHCREHRVRGCLREACAAAAADCRVQHSRWPCGRGKLPCALRHNR